MRWKNVQSSSRKSSQSWFVAFFSPFFLSSAFFILILRLLLQIENSFSLSVPIFKQFHKNIIGKGGANIKKARLCLLAYVCKPVHL